MKETIRIHAGGNEAEQFGGAALGSAGGGEESSMGLPTPATLEDLEVFFTVWRGLR